MLALPAEPEVIETEDVVVDNGRAAGRAADSHDVAVGDGGIAGRAAGLKIRYPVVLVMAALPAVLPTWNQVPLLVMVALPAVLATKSGS